MNHVTHNIIVNFIWGIADDVLRDVYVRGKYRDVILPMTVIRRLDALLEPSKEKVLGMKKQLDGAGIANQHAALCQASGEAFYNVSPFTLRDLKNRAKQQQLKADFEAYLDGFSPNVQEILDKFKFRNQIPTLIEADILGHLIEKFLDARTNLSPKPVLDVDGNELLPALDNHAMGTIFEELIRRFNEENNEEAGEHFTPRDVVKLMADLIFLPVADDIESGTYLVYDGACGTGGMLTVAEERLAELAQGHGKDVSIHLYGQEVQPETYAISKADLVLKGEGVEAENMKYGSTLSSDAFPSQEFDFMLSNPPYGKSWKTDLERLGGKADIKDLRFVTQHRGDPEYKMITRSSDGQLMFLVNKLSKMKHSTKLGSRIAEVHNGSSLFTGDAGQGESNIRRWIIENDWLEAIIALPENMFYNTGIATYIWMLTNRKPDKRRGKVQLIDASEWFVPLRRNLGKKNCEFSEEHIRAICDLVVNPVETEKSKIFPNEAFGYWKVTVDRPLRLAVDLSPARLERFERTCTKAKEEPPANLTRRLAETIGAGPHLDFNAFMDACDTDADKHGVKLTAKRKKLLQSELCDTREDAAPVLKKVHKPGKATPDPIHGLFEAEVNGKTCVVEYDPDTALRDSEQVPLLEEGGIEAFFRREVLPYTPDAWIAPGKTLVGYEISFTRHFYRPAPMRTLDEIKADIYALEQKQNDINQVVTQGLDSNVQLKPSGVEWIGDIPEHWEVRRLKFLCHNLNEQTTEKLPGETYIALEHVESWTGRISLPDEEIAFDSQVKRFQPGDVLFGKLRPYLAKVTRPPIAGVCVGEFLVLRVTGNVSPEFLEQKLRSKRVIDLINSSTFGAKMPRADWTFIGNLKLAYPSADEQRGILEHIQVKSAEIDQAITRAQREIELMREYRIRLIADVVTGKVDVRGIEVPDVAEEERLALGGDTDESDNMIDDDLEKEVEQ